VQTEVEEIRYKYQLLGSVMSEKMRRRWAGSEAKVRGWGGISLVSEATGLNRRTIKRGMQEILKPDAQEDGNRIRKPGGGRRTLVEGDGELMARLEKLVSPATRGDPMSPLRWTCKSTYQLAEALEGEEKKISPSSVGRLLRKAGYSLQGNQKALEGSSHPDRNAQFENISALVQRHQQAGQPVISVDTKKKELVGPFYKAGREWWPEGKPQRVRVHDFMDTNLGKAIPYGVYDISNNSGWVSVGIDHDTARFATASIGRWWKKMGVKAYPQARKLLVTADGGGSNGSRSRLWKVALQDLANMLGIPIAVCHFPPGTSKWNKIEHRMFSFITQNWRGRPLISHEVIINLIAQTATAEGLTIRAELDKHTYATGIKVSDAQLDSLHIQPAKFHGDWNYTILPA
jgi:hypothetical protein